MKNLKGEEMVEIPSSRSDALSNLLVICSHIKFFNRRTQRGFVVLLGFLKRTEGGERGV